MRYEKIFPSICIIFSNNYKTFFLKLFTIIITVYSMYILLLTLIINNYSIIDS